jgi:hypothetical protein
MLLSAGRSDLTSDLPVAPTVEARGEGDHLDPHHSIASSAPRPRTGQSWGANGTSSISCTPGITASPLVPRVSAPVGVQAAATERLRDDLVFVLEHDLAGMASLDRVDPDAVAIDYAGSSRALRMCSWAGGRNQQMPRLEALDRFVLVNRLGVSRFSANHWRTSRRS